MAPLHHAAYNGHGSVVDQLLQGRADVNLKGGSVRAGSRVFVFLRGDVGFFSCGGDSVYVCACVYTYMDIYIYIILYGIMRYHIIYIYYIHIYILCDIIRYHIIYAYIYKSCILHKHTQICNLYVTETFVFVCARAYI